MSIVTQQNILRFEISVDYSLRVQVLQRDDYFSRVEKDLRLSESLLLHQVEEKAPTTLVVKQQVQLLLALEGVVQLQDERVV